jgi:hypothetical protein
LHGGGVTVGGARRDQRPVGDRALEELRLAERLPVGEPRLAEDAEDPLVGDEDAAVGVAEGAGL